MKRFSLLEILIPLWSVRHSNPMHSHCAASKMRGGLPFLAVPGPISYKRSCKKCCLANSFAIIKKMVKVVVLCPPSSPSPLSSLWNIFCDDMDIYFSLCASERAGIIICAYLRHKYPNNPTHIHSSGVVHLNQRWQSGYSIPQNALVHMFSAVVFFNTVFDLCSSTASSSWNLARMPCVAAAAAAVARWLCNNSGHILPLCSMLVGKLLVKGAERPAIVNSCLLCFPLWLDKAGSASLITGQASAYPTTSAFSALSTPLLPSLQY